jgi:uncharacterized membrane protein
MKKLLIVAAVIVLMHSVVWASAFTFVYQVESGEGIVYANNRNFSTLIVIQPNGKAYLYTESGQTVVTEQELVKFIKELN